MFWGSMTYSRMIAWLKVLLPLVALVLLSTLFLFAKPSNPEGSLPFAEVELAEKLSLQGVSNPYFSGQTPAGDIIAVDAASARPDPDLPNIANVQDIHVQIDFEDGGTAEFHAGMAELNTRAQTATLSNEVNIRSTTGYELRTNALSIDLLSAYAATDVPLEGKGPLGTFYAGSMEFTGDAAQGNARFHFNNGVKLLYTPAKQTR